MEYPHSIHPLSLPGDAGLVTSICLAVAIPVAAIGAVVVCSANAGCANGASGSCRDCSAGAVFLRSNWTSEPYLRKSIRRKWSPRLIPRRSLNERDLSLNESRSQPRFQRPNLTPSIEHLPLRLIPKLPDMHFGASRNQLPNPLENSH